MLLSPPQATCATARDGHRPSSTDASRGHGLWAPGVRLFRRLRFRTKASLIGIGLLVPALILGWLFFSSTNDTIARSSLERVGVNHLREVQEAIDLAQRHRDESLSAIGNAGSAAGLEGLRKALHLRLGTLFKQEAAIAGGTGMGKTLSLAQEHEEQLAPPPFLPRAGRFLQRPVEWGH